MQVGMTTPCRDSEPGAKNAGEGFTNHVRVLGGRNVRSGPQGLGGGTRAGLQPPQIIALLAGCFLVLAHGVALVISMNRDATPARITQARRLTETALDHLRRGTRKVERGR